MSSPSNPGRLQLCPPFPTMSLRSPHQHAGLLASYGNFSRMNPRRASPPSSVRRPSLAAPSASRPCTGRCPLGCCLQTLTCLPSLAIPIPIPTPTLPHPSPPFGINPPHQGPLPRPRGRSQPPALPLRVSPAPPCASQGGSPPSTPMGTAFPPGMAPLPSTTPGIPPCSPRRLLRLNACLSVRMTLSRSLGYSGSLRPRGGGRPLPVGSRRRWRSAAPQRRRFPSTLPRVQGECASGASRPAVLGCRLWRCRGARLGRSAWPPLAYLGLLLPARGRDPRGGANQESRPWRREGLEPATRGSHSIRAPNHAHFNPSLLFQEELRVAPSCTNYILEKIYYRVPEGNI